MATQDQKSHDTDRQSVLKDLLNFSSSFDSSADESNIPPSPPVESSQRSAVKDRTGTCSTNKENVGRVSVCRRGDGGFEGGYTGVGKAAALVSTGGETKRKVHASGAAMSTVSNSDSKEVKAKQPPNTKKSAVHKATIAQSKILKSGTTRKTMAKQHNMTLASLGLSVDFSASSDEGEGMPVKERIELVYKEKNINPGSKHRAKVVKHTQQTGKPKVEVKRSVSKQRSSPAKSAQFPSEFSAHNTKNETTDVESRSSLQADNVRDGGMKEKASVAKNYEAESANTLKAAPQKALKHTGSCKPCSTVGQAVKPCVSFQHRDVTIIRSAHQSDSLAVESSPSEESLLPLSESTRLDLSESGVMPSFCHLVAHQSPTGLLNVPPGHDQDFSYEHLNIGQKGGTRHQADKDCSQNKNADDLKPTADWQAASATDASENESHYVTCLATPDASSAYEAVDVSVQTNFKFSDSKITNPDPDCAQHKDTLGAKDSDATDNRSKNGTMAHVTAVCSKNSAGQQASADNRTASCHGRHTVYDTAKMGRDHDSLPQLGSETEAMVTVDAREDGTAAETAHHASTAESPDNAEQRRRFPSDSNYFSESGSGMEKSQSSKDAAQDEVKEIPSSEQMSSPSRFNTCSGLSKERPTSVEEENLNHDAVADGETGRGEDVAELLAPREPMTVRRQDSTGKPAPECTSAVRQGHLYNSSSDDDDNFEAFLQKVRTPAEPASQISNDKCNVDDFIVHDSDVTESDASDEDDDDDTENLGGRFGSRDVFESKTRGGSHYRHKKRLPLSSHYTPTSDISSSSDVSESDGDDGDVLDAGSDDVGDDDDDRFHGLSTPGSKVRPTLMSNQTPREASLKWYTPATSMKTRPRQQRDSNSGPSPPSSKGRDEKSGDPWAPPACLLRGAVNRQNTRPVSFLRSLSVEMPDHLRDAEARGYVNQFKKRQEELSTRLFKLFNFTVFENQLPADMVVRWNKRLLKTAGLCKLKRVGDKYTAAIELSSKVCDSAERVRDTLIHEMCHAVVWIINRVKEGHGRYWRYWAGKANRAHPEIPIIRRCHDYSISTKYIYRCVKCGYQLGRHSKSLDMDKKVCGHCRGRFELLVSSSRNTSGASLLATPRTPNPFAMFVKENYGSVKKQGGGLPHKEVMGALSRQFARTKINFD